MAGALPDADTPTGNATLWLPAPAGSATLQPGAETAVGWAPFERVQSSLPDIRERVSAPGQGTDGDPEPASATTSRAQLAHSASEVSIELYGSAPSALEGSHDWGGRAGGSFSATSPSRAATLAAAIAAINSEDGDDAHLDNSADEPRSAADAPRQRDSGLSDEDLALDLDEHEAQDPLNSVGTGARSSASASSQPSGRQPSLAHSRPARADSASPSPGSQSVTAASASPSVTAAGGSAIQPAPQSAAVTSRGGSGRTSSEITSERVDLWLPSPMYSSAGESASPTAPVPASPDTVS